MKEPLNIDKRDLLLLTHTSTSKASLGLVKDSALWKGGAAAAAEEEEEEEEEEDSIRKFQEKALWNLSLPGRLPNSESPSHAVRRVSLCEARRGSGTLAQAVVTQYLSGRHLSHARSIVPSD